MFLSVLLQGGFYPQAYLLLGICFFISSVFFLKRKSSKYENLLFGSACAFYIISSLANYFSIEALSYAMLPAVCFVFWQLQANASMEQKNKIAEAIAVFTVIIAFLAVVSLTGLLHVSGGVTANRLQFTFQYANAAGIYFAAVALMVRGIKNNRLSKFIIIIETALFLTQSIGAVACYFAGLVFAIFTTGKNKLIGQALKELSRTGISAIFAASLYFSAFKLESPVLFIAITGLIVLFCWFSDRADNIFAKYKINIIFALSFIILAVYLLFSQRVYQGTQTFIERLVQIIDGAAALRAHPFLGVGPGNWQYMAETWKTAQYNAQVIHSSFMQIAVNAGIPALLALAALTVYKLKSIKAAPYHKAAAIAILLHSFLDFSLEFLAIDLLLIFILNCRNENTQNIKFRKSTGAAIGVVLAVLCICFYGGMITSKAKQDYLSGRPDLAVERLKKNAPFFGGSYGFKYDYSSYLLQKGEFDESMTVAGSLPFKSHKAQRLIARNFEERGEYINALGIIFESLEEARYNIQTYEYAKQLIDKLPETGSKEYKLMYNTYVQKLNNSSTYISKGLKNQIKLQLYQ